MFHVTSKTKKNKKNSKLGKKQKKIKSDTIFKLILTVKGYKNHARHFLSPKFASKTRSRKIALCF